MKSTLLDRESVLRDGAANLQRGIETVGGRLYLTNHRLIFESHAYNVQTGTAVVPLRAISRVRKCWTRLLNVIPLLPNSIAVETSDGIEHRLVVSGRQAWIDAITRHQA